MDVEAVSFDCHRFVTSPLDGPREGRLCLEDHRHPEACAVISQTETTHRTTSILKNHHSDRHFFVAFMLAAALFLYLRTFLLPATPFIAYGDEVHYFLHAVRMLHGQMPYRDFFTFVFPGADLLYKTIFSVFGFSQSLAQSILLALGLLLTASILWVSTKILRGRLALLPPLLFLVFDFTSALDATHHWWSTLSVLAATGLLMERRTSTRIAAAGAFCGLATLFTQTEGALSLLAVLLYLLLTRRRHAATSGILREAALLLAPFVLVVGIVIGYFAAHVGLRTILYWTLYFPLTYFSTIEAHTPGAYFLQMPIPHRPAEVAPAIAYLIVHLAVPFAYVFALVRILRHRAQIDPVLRQKVLLLTLVGLAAFLSVANAATYLRLCVVAPPAFILCVWLFNGITFPNRATRAVLWTLGVLFLIYLPISRQTRPRSFLDLPTGRTAFFNSLQYEKASWFASRTHPGETFFDEPFVALALSLNSPGPIDYVLPSAFTRPQQVDALLQSMQAHQTRFIFLYPELYGPLHPGDNLAPLRAYVAANYHLANANANGQTWERNAAAKD
jgi:hypothetical protein